MNNTNTGGPAFPTGIITDANGVIVGGSNGMTLRDYFAAMASEKDIEYWMSKGFTQTVIRRDNNGNCYESQQVAVWTREQARYRYADAMLKVRGI